MVSTDQLYYTDQARNDFRKPCRLVLPYCVISTRSQSYGSSVKNGRGTNRLVSVWGSELPSLSAIARTEDERSESEVAAEIGHSESTEWAIARSVAVTALRNPENPSL